MSAELTKARKQITQVNTYLKQGKPHPAVNALCEAVLAMLKAQLMKAEREEFATLIEQAVYQLNNNKEAFIQIFFDKNEDYKIRGFRFDSADEKN